MLYFTLLYLTLLLCSIIIIIIIFIVMHCVCVSTIKSKSIVYLFPFTLVSDFINIRRAGVVLCCVCLIFSGGKAGRDSSKAGGETKILTIHPSIHSL